jgi:hypothetical protein
MTMEHFFVPYMTMEHFLGPYVAMEHFFGPYMTMKHFFVPYMTRSASANVAVAKILPCGKFSDFSRFIKGLSELYHLKSCQQTRLE